MCIAYTHDRANTDDHRHVTHAALPGPCLRSDMEHTLQTGMHTRICEVPG